MTGDDGLFRRLKKALIERALGAELTDHLGYERGDPAGRGSGNSRNGASAKTVLTEDGEVQIEVPRDRAGTFEPQLIGKGQTRFDGFDDKIISLYARGMTVREIQGHLADYRTEVSPDLISKVTDAVLDEVRDWQNRPLDPVYPVVFFDALRVKIRDEGTVKNKAIYVALGLNPSGEKDVLGLWIEQTEGAKFWLKVMNDLKVRGLNDILIAVVDGLKGFPRRSPGVSRRWFRPGSRIRTTAPRPASDPNGSPFDEGDHRHNAMAMVRRGLPNGSYGDGQGLAQASAIPASPSIAKHGATPRERT